MNKENIDISSVILKTDRLILRYWTMNDLDDFYNYCKVPGVGEMAGWSHHESKDISIEILNMFIDGKITFCIEKDGHAIGSIGIEKYNENEFPELNDANVRELGYVLAKDYWGQGIMPEACQAVMKYLFEVEKLDYITCGYFASNNQSGRVQEKLGFKLHHKGTYATRSGEVKDTFFNLISKEEYFTK